MYAFLELEKQYKRDAIVTAHRHSSHSVKKFESMSI